MSDKESGNRKREEKLGLRELVAMGVGGMVGGGIFSVLGLSVGLAGHAAPIAFAFGGLIALLTGISYSRLGLAFRSDGGSFTYLEHAFRHKNIAGMGGWLLVVGYIGTMSLYAYTFGAYGSAMLGAGSPGSLWHHVLESAIILAFLGVNLYSVKATGSSEDILVFVKITILAIFSLAGLFCIKSDRIFPVLNMGIGGLFMGAALIFVAYEGFELIPNAVKEMKDPARNLTRAIYASIIITTLIYIVVALVAVGNLTPTEINRYGEYALAVAARPSLGEAGFMLIGLAALLSTASAINATLFGTARLSVVMAKDKELPRTFSYRERTKDIPWASLVIISLITLVFVNVANLKVISSFASSCFLLIFAMINISALRLRKKIGIKTAFPLTGALLTITSFVVLLGYLWNSDWEVLIWVVAFFVIIASVELLFTERGIIRRGTKTYERRIRKRD